MTEGNKENLQGNVEEGTDGANGNNWVEKNATPWSKERLTELFIGQTIEQGSIKVELTEFGKFEGEATANKRKARQIFLFEWKIEIKFKANIAGSDVEYKGVMEIPNLSDENEADEVESSSRIDTRGPHEAELRQLLATEGLKFVRKQSGIYIRELKEEFSKGLILPTDAAKPQVITKGKTTTAVDKKSFQNVASSSTPPTEMNRNVEVGEEKQEQKSEIIHIKWNHNGTLRRFQLAENEWKFSKLLEKIRQVEPSFRESLCYSDEDGDKVIFTSTVEMDEMLSHFRQLRVQTIKIETDKTTVEADNSKKAELKQKATAEILNLVSSDELMDGSLEALGQIYCEWLRNAIDKENMQVLQYIEDHFRTEFYNMVNPDEIKNSPFQKCVIEETVRNLKNTKTCSDRADIFVQLDDSNKALIVEMKREQFYEGSPKGTKSNDEYLKSGMDQLISYRDDNETAYQDWTYLLVLVDTWAKVYFKAFRPNTEKYSKAYYLPINCILPQLPQVPIKFQPRKDAIQPHSHPQTLNTSQSTPYPSTSATQSPSTSSTQLSTSTSSSKFRTPQSSYSSTSSRGTRKRSRDSNVSNRTLTADFNFTVTPRDNDQNTPTRRSISSPPERRQNCGRKAANFYGIDPPRRAKSLESALQLSEDDEPKEHRRRVFSLKYEINQNERNQRWRWDKDEKPHLSIILLGDAETSLDAISYVLNTYEGEEVALRLLDIDVGFPTDLNVIMAQKLKAVIICFKVSVPAQVRKLATESDVEILEFNVIDVLVERVEEILSSKMPLMQRINVIGTGRVLRDSRLSEKVSIVQCVVDSGKLESSALFRFLRCPKDGSEPYVIYDDKPIELMKHGMEALSTANMGAEVEITLFNTNLTFREGDRLLAIEKFWEKQPIDWDPSGF